MTENEVDTLLKRYTVSLRKNMSRLKKRCDIKRRQSITAIIETLKLNIEELFKRKLEFKKGQTL